MSIQKIDLEELERYLMKSERTKIYRLIKKVMQAQGHWKAKPRGKPGSNFKRDSW